MNAVLVIDTGGRFEARPSTVGTSEEELALMEKGVVPPERVVVIMDELRRAAFSLASTPAWRC